MENHAQRMFAVSCSRSAECLVKNGIPCSWTCERDYFSKGTLEFLQFAAIDESGSTEGQTSRQLLPANEKGKKFYSIVYLKKLYLKK